MAATYKGLLTNNGKALIASATLNNKINYSHIAVGDGNGSVPNPLETRTALVNEKARIALNVVEINPNNTNQIICEAIIPSNLGGFYIRELGLYAGTTMVVNASYPPTYKPLVDEGGAREIAIKLVINIKNAEVIALYLDDSLIYATRTWVDTNYIRRNEVVDNLTTDDAKKPVSAKQAKALQDNKLDKTANAVSSSKLETARTISFSGAATGSFNFDGSGNSSCILALANSGVVANTYGASLKIPTITVNAKGLITGVSEQNIPIVDNLTTDDATKPLSAAQGKVLQDSKLGKTENAVSATKLQTARTIGGVSFDGSANINLPGVNTAGNQNTTGNAATATTAAACSGNAATATKLQTARTINGVSFDGSANITIADNTKLPLAGGTITGSLNVSDTITVTGVGDHANAFKKLIQANTTTDGGYIAVGNNGSDKGYVEIGTIDDPDAAIYARKRNGANTILDEAVILGPDNNTSFPNSVFIHNAIGGYGKCGLVAGAADDARYDGCNIDITSWFGLGIKSSQNGDRTVVFNTRNGDISTKGSLHATGMVNGKGLGINNTEGTGHGLSLYGGTAGGMPNYGISFAQTYHYGTRGYVNGDWATYFTMTGGNNRGWIFRHADLGNVASISSQGFLSIPTMKMDRSNFQIEHHSTFSIYYDFATRIVRIVMKVMSAVGVGHSTSPFKVVEGRWTATFALPITLQVRLSAEFAFQQVGLPGYKPWDAEAGEWHAWCAPPGHRGSTESAVTVDVVRWRGGEGEAVDGYLTVVGFF